MKKTRSKKKYKIKYHNIMLLFYIISTFILYNSLNVLINNRINNTLTLVNILYFIISLSIHFFTFGFYTELKKKNKKEKKTITAIKL